jgi:hypothetical protein
LIEICQFVNENLIEKVVLHTDAKQTCQGKHTRLLEPHLFLLHVFYTVNPNLSLLYCINWSREKMQAKISTCRNRSPAQFLSINTLWTSQIYDDKLNTENDEWRVIIKNSIFDLTAQVQIRDHTYIDHSIFRQSS